MARYFFISQEKAKNLGLPIDGAMVSKNGSKVSFLEDSLLHIGGSADTVAEEHEIELLSRDDAIKVIQKEF